MNDKVEYSAPTDIMEQLEAMEAEALTSYRNAAMARNHLALFQICTEHGITLDELDKTEYDETLVCPELDSLLNKAMRHQLHQPLTAVNTLLHKDGRKIILENGAWLMRDLSHTEGDAPKDLPETFYKPVGNMTPTTIEG